VVTVRNLTEIAEFKTQMMKEFYTADFEKLIYFFGMEFTETSNGLMMHQKKYVIDILKRFNMMSCNCASTLTEVNVKLVNNEDEELVDLTLFVQIVGALRYMLQ
jgi:hypothetical protein